MFLYKVKGRAKYQRNGKHSVFRIFFNVKWGVIKDEIRKVGCVLNLNRL